MCHRLNKKHPELTWNQLQRMNIRGVYVDGQKQREYTNKNDAALPAAMLNSIFITAAIDEKEQWDEVIMDLPRVFLNVYNDEKVVML